VKISPCSTFRVIALTIFRGARTDGWAGQYVEVVLTKFGFYTFLLNWHLQESVECCSLQLRAVGLHTWRLTSDMFSSKTFHSTLTPLPPNFHSTPILLLFYKVVEWKCSKSGVKSFGWSMSLVGHNRLTYTSNQFCTPPVSTALLYKEVTHSGNYSHCVCI